MTNRKEAFSPQTVTNLLRFSNNNFQLLHKYLRKVLPEFEPAARNYKFVNGELLT